MKYTILLIACLLMAIACSKNNEIAVQDSNKRESIIKYVSSDESINISSLNIRFSNNTDGANNWNNRKQWIVDFLYYYEIDVIGMQEEKNDQTSDLKSMLSLDYKMIGEASSLQPGYEYCGIYYRTARVELLESGRFWLSETPDKESLGWEAIYHRQVTWGKFKHKISEKVFWVFNTHFSHLSEITRQNSAKLLKSRIKTIANGEAVMVTGDFNTWPDTETYSILTKDIESGEVLTEGRKLVPRPYSANYTGHCFGECYQDGKIVDYVFVNNNVEVQKYGIITEQRKNVFLSDHFPVIARISIK